MPRAPSPASETSSDAGSDDSNPRRVKPTPAPQTNRRSESPEPIPQPPISATSIGPFKAEYGDVLLLVKGEGLSTHKYLLQRFSVLEAKLSESSSNDARPTYVLEEDSVNPDDFHNTFKILYSSPLNSPFDFDTPAFVSALRLATLYDYPELRTYSITHLSQANLGPIERIKIARECKLPEWKEPAYTELGLREEPITTEEANVLGLEALTDISRRREAALRSRARSPEPQVTSTPPSPPLASSRASISRPASVMLDLTVSSPIPITEDLGVSPSRPSSRIGERRVSGGKQVTGIKSKKERTKAYPKPCFIEAPAPRQAREGTINDVTMIELVVADCQCKTYLNPHRNPHSGEVVYQTHQVPCKLPSCAVQAFKYIQKEQIAYAERVDRLEALLERITSDPILMRRSTSS
ncbi:hypothetical protein RSOLAG1IB_02702 [Rhizoctonia solani AG-1 IB]|uniref:BTB domain-containing protein n=1 Tax=Thanatephorus cucumeris (strain AG1-IB / isolate 7/3/14) TaxID=1108050 RepID=A0A0B7FP66_THACB|nr:hypothetical protein RSOLAG1IB_02702 [Rhizoctonia solani AG-1 IB]